eukprot:Seg5920.4 transcript_id=Seg5920.4/GoldUCD/mRNA.D3Y31 product="hypothetical protein" protein_id=Seg5920.4/GoldUCD/D3Y31
MESRKRKVVSSDEAFKEIERFLYDSESDEDDDLHELYDEDEFQQHVREELVGSVKEIAVAEDEGNVGFEITERTVEEGTPCQES